MLQHATHISSSERSQTQTELLLQNLKIGGTNPIIVTFGGGGGWKQ